MACSKKYTRGCAGKAGEKMKRRVAPGFLIITVLFMAAILFLSVSLLSGVSGERQEYQLMVSLGGLKYDESFLDTVSKIRGIRQISPALEIPVRLRIEDYTMDTVISAVDIEVLEKKVRYAREAPLADTPALLLGKDSLADMRDFNGHALSEEQQKRYLADCENLEIELLTLSGDAAEENGAIQQWKSCIAAAVLDEPAAGIYLPIIQAESLCKNAGDMEVEKVLLTVRGKSNYEKVQEIFMGNAA